MKGQKALLLSFRKYLGKYSFLLGIFVLVIVLATSKNALVDGMRSSLYYHEWASVKGKGMINISTNLETEDIQEILEKAAFDAGGKIDGIEVLYSAKAFLVGEDGRTEVLTIHPTYELSGEDILLFTQYAPGKNNVIVDPLSATRYEANVLLDDVRCSEFGVSIHEAFVSPEVFWNIAFYQEVMGEGVEKNVLLDFEDGLDFKKLAENFVFNVGVFQKKSKDIWVADTVLFYDNSRTLENGFQWLYVCDMDSGNVSQKTRAHYSSEMYGFEFVNEVDRFNTPAALLLEWMTNLWYVAIAAFIFISIAVFKIRKLEFSLNRSLGMSKRKQLWLLFMEEVLMLLIVGMISVVILSFECYLLRVWSPRGQRLIAGEDIFMKDIFSINGFYQLENLWFYWLSWFLEVAILFLVGSFILNSVLYLSFRKSEVQA